MNICYVARYSIFLPILLFLQFCQPAKIFYLHTIGCKSVSLYHQAISEILIGHGHEIIRLGPFPVKHLANYTDLGEHDSFFQFTDTFNPDQPLGTMHNQKLVFEAQLINCENVYKNAQLNRILNTSKLDLVIFEVDGADCFLPLITRFGVPIIGVGISNGFTAEFDGLIGNPVNPSYVPTLLSALSTKMNFFQRLDNTKNFILHWLLMLYYNRQADKMVAKYLPDSPPIGELYDRISLAFYNSHSSFVPRPIAPNSIGIAGIQIKEASPLPKEIENFINDAKEGVIFLSFGSVVEFSEFPANIREAFTNVLTKLPYHILWRHDKPEMFTEISENIMVRKWFPQKDILAHTKTILFLSHGGIMSTYEAIHYNVPLVTFPVTYDQFTNAAIVQSLEIGLSLDLRNLDENTLLRSIADVMNNTRYRENMKKLSDIFKDRPLSPRDTLIYWVDYVLRHKNLSHLKPAGSKLPFYQYLLLDVISFLLVKLLFVSWIIYFVSCRYIFKKSNK